MPSHELSRWTGVMDTYLGKVKRATNIALKARNSICMADRMSTEVFGHSTSAL